jgi:iron complex outermembrane recepter protein
MLQTATPFLIRVCRSADPLRRLVLLIVLVALVPAMRGTASTVKRHYEVSAGDAANTLRQFVAQSGEQIVYLLPRVRGVKTNALKGEFTAREALEQMLANTALVVVEDRRTGALLINRVPPRGHSSPDERWPTPSQPETRTPKAEQPMKRETLLTKLAATFAVIAAPLMTAQVAPAVLNGPVELSPFNVDASRDVGYLAGNTLAGSRLNTSLKDTAASISVLTEEFLADIGALDLTDAIAYANNVQLDRDDTTPTLNGNTISEFYHNYRVRGLRASTARNYIVWNIPGDTYNIERIDDSRGPNSILYGIGGAGGLLNSSTKQARADHTRQSLSYSAGTFNSHRATVDVNQPIIRHQLALRLNGLWTGRKTSRHHTGNRDRRFDIAAMYRPLEQTTVRVEFERGEKMDRVGRPWTIYDQFSLWDTAGRPTRVYTASAVPASGITRLGSGTRIVLNDSDGTLLNRAGTLRTNDPRFSFTDPVVTDRGKIDYSVNPSGPGARRDMNFSAFTATLDQKLPGRNFLNIAYAHQEYDFLGHDPTDAAHTLFGDPNETLPGIGVNPFAGRYYIETNWYRRHRRERFDEVRATLSSEFDIQKWGNYRLALMGELKKHNFWRVEQREFLQGAPFTPASAGGPGMQPENSANVVYRRFYVTERDWSTYRAGGGADNLFTGLRDPVTGRTLSSTWIQRSGNTDDDDDEMRTVLLGGQARYFGGRLIGTFGLRRDEQDIFNRGTTRHPVTDEIIVDYSDANATRYNHVARTRTFGFVGHVYRGFSLLYNQSSSRTLPNPVHRMLPGAVQAQQAEGEGKDMGLSVDLANGRIFAKAVYFKTASERESGLTNTGTIVGIRNNRVLDALLNNNQITAAEAAGRRTEANAGYFDRESDGYEFQVIANATQHWRFTGNFSITNAVESNIFPEVAAWAEDAIAFWSTKNTSLITSGNRTIAEEIAFLRDDIQHQRSVEGVGSIGNRRYKANLFTRYEFSWPALKGLYIGGGYRYQSKMLTALTPTGRKIRAPSTDNFDAVIGYSLPRFRNGTRVSFQLNVFNVLDDTDPQITRYDATGVHPRRFNVVEPRTFRLTTNIRFR